MSVTTSKPRLDTDQVDARIDVFLDAIGLGPLDPETVHVPLGRNDVRSGRVRGGGRVFVKRIVGTFDQEAEARLDRVLAFESFVAAAGTALIRSPRLLGHDRPTRLLAFEDIPEEADRPQDRAPATFWTADDSVRLGELVSGLHEMGSAPAEAEEDPPPLPPVALFDGLPLWTYENCSFGELEMWHLLQRDDELAAGLTRLRADAAAAPRVPIHGDLRFDQLIGPRDRPYLTDWEEFRLDDGARDVGSLAGDWLHAAIRDIITGNDGTIPASEYLTHDDVLARGSAAVQGVRPSIARFWSAYRDGRGELDEGFVARATAFTGWHLIDRLMASAKFNSRLHGIDLAAAGIGRAMALHPDRFASTVGFGETS